MLTEFNFHAPSFVVAGRNSVHQTGELLNQWGAGKNIMVVCGNKTYSLGLLNSLLDSIRSGGFTPCVFHGSLPDAPVETVRSGITYAKEHDVSAIVAFGGGRAMDTAKARDKSSRSAAATCCLPSPPLAVQGQRALTLGLCWIGKQITSIFLPIPLPAPMWLFWIPYC